MNENYFCFIVHIYTIQILLLINLLQNVYKITHLLQQYLWIFAFWLAQVGGELKLINPIIRYFIWNPLEIAKDVIKWKLTFIVFFTDLSFLCAFSKCLLLSRKLQYIYEKCSKDNSLWNDCTRKWKHFWHL